MLNTSAFLLQKGTTILAGKASSLFGQSGGGRTVVDIGIRVDEEIM